MTGVCSPSIELGVTPQISTGVLHRSAGAGQIGAGVAHQPVEPFRAALDALVQELDGAADGAQAASSRIAEPTDTA
jgi:hypothetical protein